MIFDIPTQEKIVYIKNNKKIKTKMKSLLNRQLLLNNKRQLYYLVIQFYFDLTYTFIIFQFHHVFKIFFLLQGITFSRPFLYLTSLRSTSTFYKNMINLIQILLQLMTIPEKNFEFYLQKNFLTLLICVLIFKFSLFLQKRIYQLLYFLPVADL